MPLLTFCPYCDAALVDGEKHAPADCRASLEAHRLRLVATLPKAEHSPTAPADRTDVRE